MDVLSVVFFFLAIGISLGVALGLILGAGPLLMSVGYLLWSILSFPKWFMVGYRQATTKDPQTSTILAQSPLQPQVFPPTASVGSPLTNVYRNHKS